MKRVVVVVLCLAGAVVLGWWTFNRVQMAPWRPALQSREIAAQVLAEYLARQMHATNALVFGNPFVQRPDQSAEIYAFEAAEVRGLEKGFGTLNRLKVVYPDLRPEFLARPQSVFIDPKTSTPLSFLVADDAFDRLASENSGFDLAVSLIGLPVNVRQANVWQSASKTRFALLLPDWRMIGGAEAIREAFTSGKLAAAIINRPGAIGRDLPVPPSEYQEVFERRFILVTKENVDQLLRRYPQVF